MLPCWNHLKSIVNFHSTSIAPDFTIMIISLKWKNNRFFFETVLKYKFYNLPQYSTSYQRIFYVNRNKNDATSPKTKPFTIPPTTETIHNPKKNPHRFEFAAHDPRQNNATPPPSGRGCANRRVEPPLPCVGDSARRRGDGAARGAACRRGGAARRVRGARPSTWTSTR